MDLLTTAQAAERLGVSVRRVQALIKADRLKATRFGDVWLVQPWSVAKFKRLPIGWKKGRKRS